MNIVVAQISEDEGLSVHHLYPEGEPGLIGGDGNLVGQCEVHLQASRIGNKVELIGSVTAVVASECDRCLALLRMPVEKSFELLYVPPLATQEEKELLEKDLSIGFYQGDVIEVDDLVREQVELALPMSRVCNDECRGLCSECGANLNENDCTCEREPVDGRWAVLNELKSKLN
ncbi:MAG: DUF177 domain-containing protein [Blastocatellia bacterium]